MPALSHRERELRRLLSQAVLAGDVATVRQLLSDGACAYGPFNDDNNQTLLHYSAIVGSRPVVEALLSANLDPDYVDNYGWTPMRYAYFYGRKEMVEALQDAGVSLSDTLISHTWTPLMQAIAAGALQEVANLIQLDHGLDSTDASGQTPLHLACVRGDGEGAMLLLRSGASPNMQDIYGWTPLMCAARSRHAELVTALLGAGADPRYVDVEGFTLLHTAAQMGDLDILSTVLDWRGDLLDLRDHRKRTALILAAQYKHADIVNWLLCEGAGVNAISQREETALGVAAGLGSSAYDICERLLRAGANPNAEVFEQQQTALMVAAHRNAEDVVSLLLRFGAKLEQEDKDGATTLAYAADGNSAKTVRILLESGANPDASQGLPLRVASRHGHSAVVYELLCHDASPNPRETQLLATGMSPLHYAANFGHTDVAAYLLQAGASRNDVDQYGFCAAERAERQDCRETGKLIRRFQPTLQHMCAATIWNTLQEHAGQAAAARENIAELPVGYMLRRYLQFPYSLKSMNYRDTEN